MVLIATHADRPLLGVVIGDGAVGKVGPLLDCLSWQQLGFA